jgi:hypothetical protein
LKKTKETDQDKNSSYSVSISDLFRDKL